MRTSNYGHDERIIGSFFIRGGTIMIRLRGIYAILLLLGITMVSVGFWQSTSAKKEEPLQEDAYEVMSPKTMDVVLQRVYLDGEMSEEVIKETVGTMEEFLQSYEGWTLIEQSENQVILRKEVDDISPMLKINGYFGLTKDDILSIFEGEPNEENVIQSFFQIDTKKLKSADHEQLKKGIRVESVQQYKKVIEAFEAIKTEKEIGAF